ncbi:hypothetical protein TNCV_3110881 [Trichonephila clavipes]|nr:hypothetical protein TNCV_3110881 [Trichonephila clavipes]
MRESNGLMNAPLRGTLNPAGGVPTAEGHFSFKGKRLQIAAALSAVHFGDEVSFLGTQKNQFCVTVSPSISPSAFGAANAGNRFVTRFFEGPSGDSPFLIEPLQLR